MNRAKVRNWLLLLVASFTSLLSSCGVMSRLEPEYYQEHTIASREGSYTINPDIILESLAQGKKDVFVPKTEEDGVVILGSPVQWSQADYLRVAQALHELVWGDTWQGWKFNLLFFRLDCKQVNKGPQHFAIRLYKIIHNQSEETRLVHEIDIKPSLRSADWKEYEKHPVRQRWTMVDLTQIGVSAESALQLAELNGGLESRLAVEDRCIIFITYYWKTQWGTGRISDQGWSIDYSMDNTNTNFAVYIDPLTGEIK